MSNPVHDDYLKRILETIDEARKHQIPVLFSAIRDQSIIKKDSQDQDQLHIHTAFGGTYDHGIAMITTMVDYISDSMNISSLMVMGDICNSLAQSRVEVVTANAKSVRSPQTKSLAAPSKTPVKLTVLTGNKKAPKK